MTIRRERVGMVDLNTNPPELNLTFSASELWNSKMDNKLLTVHGTSLLQTPLGTEGNILIREVSLIIHRSL